DATNLHLPYDCHCLASFEASVSCRSPAEATKLLRDVSRLGNRLKASHTTKPRNPTLRRRSSESALCSPLSLIRILSGGTSAINRSLVFNETSKVLRSRLFTPTILAPEFRARRNSSDVCTSGKTSSPSSSTACA